MMIYFSPIAIDPEDEIKHGEIIGELKADERVADMRFAEDIDGAILIAIENGVDPWQFAHEHNGHFGHTKEELLQAQKEEKLFNSYQEFEDFIGGSFAWLDLYGFGYAPAIEQQALVEELEGWFDVPGNFAIFKDGEWKFFEEWDFEVEGLPVPFEDKDEGKE